MRVKNDGNAVTLWASKWDTEDWATKPGAAWPCSTLRGHRFCATFDSNGLLDLTVDGRYPSESMDIDGHELSAICADLLRDSGKGSPDDAWWLVAVGQFQ